MEEFLRAGSCFPLPVSHFSFILTNGYCALEFYFVYYLWNEQGNLQLRSGKDLV